MIGRVNIVRSDLEGLHIIFSLRAFIIPVAIVVFPTALPVPAKIILMYDRFVF